jgi:acyl carrier protein
MADIGTVSGSTLSHRTFCRVLSEHLSHDDVCVEVRPGVHLVDDLGFDSLAVLEYVLALEELGLTIDIGDFDKALLDVDVAYGQYLVSDGTSPPRDT